MLVLTRKEGEAVVVDSRVKVVVLEIRGDRVRLGFNAPYDVAIHREEVQLRIDRRDAADRLVTCGAESGTVE